MESLHLHSHPKTFTAQISCNERSVLFPWSMSGTEKQRTPAIARYSSKKARMCALASLSRVSRSTWSIGRPGVIKEVKDPVSSFIERRSFTEQDFKKQA
jgi:hypothetical protein